MFVYCLVLVSVLQVVWTLSLQEMHRKEPLYFFIVGNALGADGTLVNFWWSRDALNLSSECNEKYDCQHVIPPSEKMFIVHHQPYIPRGTEASDAKKMYFLLRVFFLLKIFFFFLNCCFLKKIHYKVYLIM